MLQKLSISEKSCTFKLYSHQRILRNKMYQCFQKYDNDDNNHNCVLIIWSSY